MSKLLLDSQPIVIIPELACILGLNESIIFQQIHYWLEIYKNHSDPKERIRHHRDGKVWVFNSMPKWCENFPFLAQRTIERAFASLKEKGLLYTENFNEMKQDRTLWYSINYEKFEEYEKQAQELIKAKKEKNQKPQKADKQALRQIVGMHPSKCQDVTDNLGSPIPENTTENTTENNKSVSQSVQEEKIQTDGLTDDTLDHILSVADEWSGKDRAYYPEDKELYRQAQTTNLFVKSIIKKLYTNGQMPKILKMGLTFDDIRQRLEFLQPAHIDWALNKTKNGCKGPQKDIYFTKALLTGIVEYSIDEDMMDIN